jgi:DNA (cytosine-5)-methyltransferase 1
MTHARVLDLFCGTGGFSYGFDGYPDSPFRTVLGVDVDRCSARTFKANHRHADVACVDLRATTPADLGVRCGFRPGEVDVIVGGPPCQGFSSLRPGRASGLDDPRNSLFRPFRDWVSFMRPSVFVMENVVGLATHDGGRTIERIVDHLSGAGYSCDWKILNAANFGVPQRRERLIVAGVAPGLMWRWPSPTHRSDGATIGHRDKARVISVDSSLDLSPAVTVEDAIGDLPALRSGERTDEYADPPATAYQRERRGSCRALTMHESTRHSDKMLEIIRHSGDNRRCVPEHLVSSGYSSSYSRLMADEPSVTITVNFVHPASNRCIHPSQDRALTPREGARLQSFDDDFAFAGTRTETVRQIGNAVPPLLGRALARSAKGCLGA